MEQPASPIHGLARSGVLGLLAFLLGVLLQLQQPMLWPHAAYLAICLLAPVVIAWEAIKNIVSVRSFCLGLLAIGCLGFASTGLRASWYAQHQLEPRLEGRDILVTGIVSNLPQASEAGLRFRLAVESAQLQGEPIVLPKKIDVGWYAGVYPTGNDLQGLQRQPVAVQAGERWQMVLRLKAPHGSSNPQGFDYELWAWEQGVQANAYVRAGSADPAPQLLGQTWRHPVDWLRQWVRARIVQSVSERASSGLITALVVGDQAAIDRAEWDVYRATGVAHLVSISGLHITMFAWGASWLVGWVWRRSTRATLAVPAPTAALWGGLLLALGYAVFSGWGIPAQRTCIMLTVVTALRLSGYRWPWPLVWTLACAVVVACDPWAMLQPGFWLSFVAVGVLFATDLRAAYAHSMGVIARLGAMLREQWLITLALAPLTLLLFGQLSLVGLLANALAIPWVTLVLTPLAMLGALVPAVLSLATWVAQALLFFLQFLSSLPGAALAFPTPPLWLALVASVGALMLVFPWPWSLRLPGVVLLAPVFLWQAPARPEGEFELLAADVGQGNAVLVRTAHHAVLFDAGPRYSLESDAGHRVLVPLLQSLNVQLDRVILSHRDTDHVGGAATVLVMQPQADLLSSIELGHPLQALRPIAPCVAGQSWVWDSVVFSVLHPDAASYAEPSKPNTMSCVLQIRALGQARGALLVGDIEKAQESHLIANGADLRAQVLLVPHHGSKTSSSEAFIDAVQPDFAMVQAGYRNRFGHPAPVVRQRYADKKIEVLDSAHCGAMTWQSWQPQQMRCQRAAEPRYWHHQVP